MDISEKKELFCVIKREVDYVARLSHSDRIKPEVRRKISELSGNTWKRVLEIVKDPSDLEWLEEASSKAVCALLPKLDSEAMLYREYALKVIADTIFGGNFGLQG